MDTREHLLHWLRDAHGMEVEALDILEKQAARLESYPEMQARVQQHAEETRRQAEQVAGCIERLGGDTSTVKDVVGKVMGTMAALTNAMAGDEVVKNALADYAFEHFEIACYRSLIAAAEAAGEERTAGVCREILREEEAMAGWVGERVPTLTQSFLQRDAAGLQAKR
jgi:ferritin-like metal-binding protein YciE